MLSASGWWEHPGGLGGGVRGVVSVLPAPNACLVGTGWGELAVLQIPDLPVGCTAPTSLGAPGQAPT